MSNSINPTKINDNGKHNLEDLNKPEMNNEESQPISTPIILIDQPKPSIAFWSENPNILLDTRYALEFFPTENMSFNQKLNAVTRIVLMLTVISYLVTKKMNIIMVSVVSIVCIYLMYYSHKGAKNEGFDNDANGLVKPYNRHGPLVDIKPELESTFQQSTPSNPLSNVLISDYDYNPNRKPAQPSYTENGNQTILDETIKTIQSMHPGQPNIDKKLFQDVTDNLELEQSMRQFYSTANTTIPNDQTSFAEFCYGDMISAKEDNAFASVRNNPRHNLY
jgi:hypothetical protein